MIRLPKFPPKFPPESPFEDFLPEPPESLKRLKEGMERIGNRIERMLPGGKTAQGNPAISERTAQSSSVIVTRRGLDEERLAYQEELARGEIWLLEAHLKNKGLGCGGDLECTWKHSDNIIRIADETLSMTTDPFWQNLKALAEEIRSKSHPEDVKRGTYAGEYPALAVRLSEFRAPLQKKAMERIKLSLEAGKR